MTKQTAIILIVLSMLCGMLVSLHVSNTFDTITENMQYQNMVLQQAEGLK